MQVNDKVKINFDKIPGCILSLYTENHNPTCEGVILSIDYNDIAPVKVNWENGTVNIYEPEWLEVVHG